MARPNVAAAPLNAKTVLVSGIDASAVVSALVYTVPAGRIAVVTFANWTLTSGAAPTLALQPTISGVTINLQVGAVGQFLTPSVWLQAADAIRWQVTIGGVAALVAAAFTVQEYEAV